MIKEIPDALNKDINVADLQKNISEFLNHIFEFKFKININNSIFDGFLRRNNYTLSKIYGSYEFDIFGNPKVSNFGDLILSGNENLKSVAEAWITKDAQHFKVQIQEAYIAPSSGDPEIDISKRIWMYYVNPADFVGDVIKFIKHFEDIEAPVYMKEEYKKISDRLKPYNDKFLASELYSSEKFKPKFDEFVRENNISAIAGSLIISSNDLDNNFVFARELSEKIIFPVMNAVPGREDFIEIIKTHIK